jgi:hypothetical protein
MNARLSREFICRARLLFFHRSFLGLLVLALAGVARAQITAQDDAAKTNYTGGWSSGLNGGTGFGAWTMVNSPNNTSNSFSGFFIEGGANQISVSNKSFAMFANGASAAITPWRIVASVIRSPWVRSSR